MKELKKKKKRISEKAFWQTDFKTKELLRYKEIIQTEVEERVCVEVWYGMWILLQNIF